MSPVCDEAEQVIKLPNSYFDRGYRKGKKEGREELLQTIPTAIKMLQEGMDLQFIVEKTGLSRPEVEKIKQQLEHS
ncbi:hypothetical protein QQ991_04925 [Weizmannia coagulans]|uniref:Transposase n=2 Tax=Heyndrickxia TaxID=2837504 RepID=A0A0C5CBY6_HEYCO|nr:MULTISPECIES: hypothetical protein [Heyndrickxia]AJO24351.1 hypothetical protein SB48_HM08orf05673 [Heyndrickxia coagulans]AKN54183.1 hypothetical protein AB434_1778 [Heyndrickxia coagulans]ATW84202.1 hypothetical protein CIW84_15085 [Heyndrickxia coagulans]KGB30491.1 hypothetical protein IE89_04695 [Heyndrickxia coagulans]KXT20949.1 hypothetical protein UZ35_06830 [Heyndrickxia coagulans]